MKNIKSYYKYLLFITMIFIYSSCVFSYDQATITRISEECVKKGWKLHVHMNSYKQVIGISCVPQDAVINDER